MSGTYVIRTENENTFKAEEDERGRLSVNLIKETPKETISHRSRNKEFIGTFADRDTLIEHFKHVLCDPINFLMPKERCRELVTGENLQI